MGNRNRVKIRVCGNDYFVTSEESEEYIRMIGTQVDDHIHRQMENSPAMSTSMAAVLTAMDYCDEAYKANKTADNLRAQVKEYLDDAEKARTELEAAKSEEAAAKRELQNLRREVQALQAGNNWQQGRPK